MKVIVAGSRDIFDYELVVQAIQASGLEVSMVVSGGARGVDQLGERWAREHGVPVVRFPADWARYGRAAGPRRNLEMLAYADAVVAVWDGQSRGTAGLVAAARARGKPVFILPTAIAGGVKHASVTDRDTVRKERGNR